MSFPGAGDNSETTKRGRMEGTCKKATPPPKKKTGKKSEQTKNNTFVFIPFFIARNRSVSKFHRESNSYAWETNTGLSKKMLALCKPTLITRGKRPKEGEGEREKKKREKVSKEGRKEGEREIQGKDCSRSEVIRKIGNVSSTLLQTTG